jgi:hypothetical protein
MILIYGFKLVNYKLYKSHCNKPIIDTSPMHAAGSLPIFCRSFCSSARMPTSCTSFMVIRFGKVGIGRQPNSPKTSCQREELTNLDITVIRYNDTHDMPRTTKLLKAHLKWRKNIGFFKNSILVRIFPT